jgi:hypothetical protein
VVIKEMFGDEKPIYAHCITDINKYVFLFSSSRGEDKIMKLI